MAMKSFQVGIKGVIVNDNSEVLLVKSLKGYWEFPGGRIDDDETIDRTLTRELKEEITNISDIEIKEILHVTRMPFDVGNDLGLVLVFVRVRAEIDNVPQISSEHLEAGWFGLEEARGMLDDNAGQALANLF